jgi:hypothetical protein
MATPQPSNDIRRNSWCAVTEIRCYPFDLLQPLPQIVRDLLRENIGLWQIGAISAALVT